MPREQLQALAADVRRLLTAGAASAPGDERLGQRVGTLLELARKVPALAPAARAARRVTASDPDAAPRALLDLLALVRQVCGALAAPDGAGPAVDVEASGPWQTSAPVREVYPVVDALGAGGDGRAEKLRKALEGWAAPDLRLMGPLQSAFAEKGGRMSELVARQAPELLGPAAVPELRRGLDLRGHAGDGWRLVAICRLGPAGFDLCLRAFEEGSPPVRQAALEGVAVAAPDRAEAVFLGQLAAETTREMRVEVVEALGRLGQTARAAIPALVAVLEDENGLGPSARTALVEIGRPAVPALAATLRDGSDRAREGAARVLKCLGGAAEEAAPALLDCLRELLAQNFTGTLFCQAALALAAAAPRHPEAAPLLTRVVRRGGVSQREAIEALGGLPTTDPQAGVALAEVLARSKEMASLRAAVDALGRLGPAAVSAIPSLLRLLGDRVAQQWAAAEALALVGPHDPAAVVPDVVEALLKEETPLTRIQMMEILKRIGPPAREAALALGLFAESGADRWERAQAAEALRSIEGLPAAG